jgi:hypothetical protein
MTVDFFSYCCHKDKDKLLPALDDHVKSHGYNFNSVNVVFQRTEIVEGNYNSHYIAESEYNKILSANGIDPDNAEADDYTHGWSAAHYWKHHCVNHLKALNESKADYIVLADADCYIKNQRHSWIDEGIKILRNDKSVLVVSPSDGTPKSHKTQNMSQQMFLCDRQRLLSIDFDLPFEGFKDGGPMQEYYFMLEGRIGRYMEKKNLFRFMLNSEFRYWHSQW